MCLYRPRRVPRNLPLNVPNAADAKRPQAHSTENIFKSLTATSPLFVSPRSSSPLAFTSASAFGTPLRPIVFERAMGAILSGTNRVTKPVEGVGIHQQAILEHFRRRALEEGTGRLRPMLKIGTGDDDEDDAYCCFAPYDIDEEPMARIPTNPRRRPTTMPRPSYTTTTTPTSTTTTRSTRLLVRNSPDSGADSPTKAERPRSQRGLTARKTNVGPSSPAKKRKARTTSRRVVDQGKENPGTTRLGRVRARALRKSTMRLR
jgi:hypothetical protein